MEHDRRQHPVIVIPPGACGDRSGPEDQTALARPGSPDPAKPANVSPFRRFLAHVPGVTSLVALWLFMLDDQAPDGLRLAVLASFAYFILPMDLIWDFFLAPLGYADDLAVFWGLVAFIGSKNLVPYRQQARAWLRGS